MILASDSQATEETGNVRHPIPKLHNLGARSVWGGSGGVQILSEVGTALNAAQAVVDALPRDQIGQNLVSLVRPSLVRHYTNHLSVPGYPPSSPASSFLATGFSVDGDPWIVEVDPRCNYSHYESLGFHAIGSAAGFAQLANSLLAHFALQGRPLSHGKLVAYRVLDAAIETSSFGVDGPIQMWTATMAGVAQVPTEELDQIRASVGGWKEFERDGLNEFLAAGDPATAEDVLAEPMPEPIQSDVAADNDSGHSP